MTNDMTIILGGTTLPKYSTFRKLIIPNETDVVTLGGTLYTDFVNNRRAWIIGWKLLKMSDFDTIYTLFEQQYENESYHVLNIDIYDILTPVKMEIKEQNIKFNGSLVEDFSITLKEQYAFS